MKKDQFDIIYFDNLDSTNNYAKKYIEKHEGKDICNKVIVADYQTKGRGSFENKWQSEKGKNLTFSIIICPEIFAKDQFYISKITSLALIYYLEAQGIVAKIKWPNDILFENKKISGILIENSILGDSLTSSIVGIGININQKKFDVDLNATSINIIKSSEYDKTKELEKILNSYIYVLNLCKNKRFEYIDRQYFNKLLGKREFLKYRKESLIFEAIIEDIDEYGRLILKERSGRKKIYGFKEVELVL